MNRLSQKGFSLVGVLLIVVSLTAMGFAGNYVYSKNKDYREASSRKAADDLPAEQQEEQKVVIKGVEIENVNYYRINLVTGRSYYGKIAGLDNDFFMLSPVFYNDTKGGIATLIPLGSELHKPEPAMYVNELNVQSISEVVEGSSVNSEMIELENDIAVVKLNDPGALEAQIRDDLLQALFFEDGTVYFTNAISIASPELSFNEANTYYLVNSGSEQTQISLSKAEISELKSYKTADVLFWENLNPSGQVSVAISEYLKNPPR